LIVLDEYDDRTARGHVFRLRELLGQTPAALRTENPSVFSLLANPKVHSPFLLSVLNSVIDFEMVLLL
jgi:hypothetical protein